MIRVDTDPGSFPHDADSSDADEAAVEFGNLSVLETAARRGLGPLSELGTHVWHGESKPCVSCGELVARSADRCDLCGQDLGVFMLERMRLSAGPWYVMEHIRPFPGVTLERLIKQAKKGVLTRTTVVRGPTTDHQWRFAGETPGLSQFVGCCWRCQADIDAQDKKCRSCKADLLPTAQLAETVLPHESDDAQPALSNELMGASEYLNHTFAAPLTAKRSFTMGSLSVWLACLLLLALLGIVMALIRSRNLSHSEGNGVAQVVFRSEVSTLTRLEMRM